MSDTRRPSVHFDEDNLRDNETMIKQEGIGTMKIAEPKTPYHAYLSGSDDEDESMSVKSAASSQPEASNKFTDVERAMMDNLSRDKTPDPEFEKKRKANYHNMGNLLKQKPVYSDEDDE
eukprot:Rmarinus@m.15230